MSGVGSTVTEGIATANADGSDARVVKTSPTIDSRADWGPRPAASLRQGARYGGGDAKRPDREIQLNRNGLRAADTDPRPAEPAPPLAEMNLDRCWRE
jgi:hypothetical protein